MTPAQTYSDEDIIAYLDDVMPLKDKRAFAQQLETDVLLQKRLTSLGVNFDPAKKGYEKALDHAPQAPEFLQEEPQSKTPFMRMAGSIAALFLAGFIGYSLSFLNSTPAQSGWMNYVAAYQALYANSTLSHITPDKTRELAEIKRVSDSLGTEFDHTKLSGMKQIDYKRAQILSFKGRPLIQFTYLSKLGAPIALCVIRSDKRGDAKPVYGIRESQASASWSKNGYEYILIGGRDQNIIKQASDYFYRTL